MQTLRVLAIDPGQTVGLAWYRQPEVGGKVEPIIGSLRLNYTEVLDYLEKEHKNHPWTDIVIESFQTSGRLSKYGLLTIDLAGRIKGWCYAYNVYCTTQMPGSRTAWKDKAERLHPGRSKLDSHNQDAIAHLLQYLERQLSITV